MVTKRKVGRKLAGDGWHQRVREQVLRWFNTPDKDRRQELFGVRTDEEFAEQLGVHRNTLYNIRKQAIHGRFNKFGASDIEREALVPVRYPRAITTQPVVGQAPAKVIPPVSRVASALCFGARIAQEKLGVPLAS